MAKHLVLVAGNIGAGKTSLTERLAARLDWYAGYESVADNPYLGDFYGDMRSWSFHLQIFFLGHRAAQHRQLALDPRSAIIDRSIYEDAYIFARALHEMGNLSERDYTSYLRLYNLIVESLPPPALGGDDQAEGEKMPRGRPRRCTCSRSRCSSQTSKL